MPGAGEGVEQPLRWDGSRAGQEAGTDFHENCTHQACPPRKWLQAGGHFTPAGSPPRAAPGKGGTSPAEPGARAEGPTVWPLCADVCGVVSDLQRGSSGGGRIAPGRGHGGILECSVCLLYGSLLTCKPLTDVHTNTFVTGKMENSRDEPH